MKKLESMLLLFLLVSGNSIYGQELKPVNIMEQPQKYQRPHDDNDLSPDTMRVPLKVWVVYSDRDSNETFREPGQMNTYKKLSFLESFYVTDEQGEYVRIASDPHPDGMALSVDAVDYGWIQKRKLILWPHALMTSPGNIAKKGMVLNTIESTKLRGGQPDIVEFRKGPDATYGVIGQSLLFEIFFVLKHEGQWVFLARDEFIHGGTTEGRLGSVAGWAPSFRVTEWDFRKAIEPNWEIDAANERRNGNKARIFGDQVQAIRYKRGESVDPSKVLWEDDLYENRRIGDWRRFPILSASSDKDILAVGTMGEIYGFSDGQAKPIVNSDGMAGINNLLNRIIAGQRKVNICFVIDGTTSMGPYFKATAAAIGECVNSLKALQQNNSFKYGALIYRDFAEKERLYEILPLDDQTDPLVAFLDPAKAYDVYDVDEPEAVLYGLKKAIREIGFVPGEANIAVLVGDAGNHHRQDETTVTVDDIVSLLSSSDIDVHLLTFQVHNKGTPTYDDFIHDATRIMYEVAKNKYVDLKAGFPGTEFQPPDTFVDGKTATLRNGVTIGAVYGLEHGAVLDPEKLTREISQAVLDVNSLHEMQITELKKMSRGEAGLKDVKSANAVAQKDGNPNTTSSFAPGILNLLKRLWYFRRTVANSAAVKTPVICGIGNDTMGCQTEASGIQGGSLPDQIRAVKHDRCASAALHVRR